jgi:hypothetical protein
MSTTAVSIASEINPNDPALFAIQTDNPSADAYAKPKLSGLVRNPDSGRYSPRQDIPEPYTPDELRLLAALLALDHPLDFENPFRSRANALVGCGRLLRIAVCDGGDEARAYHVYCGQGTLCQRCGSGPARARKQIALAPELHSLMNSSRLDLQTFTFDCGGPCIDGTALVNRIQQAKSLSSRLRSAIRRKLKPGTFGQQVAYTVNPESSVIEFRFLWRGLTLRIGEIRSIWARVCGGAIGRTSSAATRRFESGSARKALTALLSGLEPLLKLPPEERVLWAHAIAGIRLTSVCGEFRGKWLKAAIDAEGIWVEDEAAAESPDDSDCCKHGRCSKHGTPLRMTNHAPATADDLSRRFSRVYFGPMGMYRDKVDGAPHDSPHLSRYGPS